jgi:hypothetical protein
LGGPKDHNGQQEGDQPQDLEDKAKGFPIDPANYEQSQYHHDPVQEPLQPGDDPAVLIKNALAMFHHLQLSCLSRF